MTFAALRPLADRAVLFTALRQDALAAATEALGEHRWDADITAGTLTFTAEGDTGRRIATRAHLIATVAPGPRSVMWAWNHPGGEAHTVAAQVRDYGAQHGLADLVQPELPFPADAPAAGDELDEWITKAAHQLGAACTEITGRSPHYSAPVGGGTRALFLLDAPLPALTLADAVTALPRVLTETAPADARSCVWDLARLAGWHLEWTDASFTGATVRDAVSAATFRFDAQARITGIEARLPA